MLFEGQDEISEPPSFSLQPSDTAGIAASRLELGTSPGELNCVMESRMLKAGSRSQRQFPHFET